MGWRTLENSIDNDGKQLTESNGVTDGVIACGVNNQVHN